MSPIEYEAIVEDGRENYRKETERKIREELLRRHREELENLGVLKALWLETKIWFYARRAAKHHSGGSWYFTA